MASVVGFLFAGEAGAAGAAGAGGGTTVVGAPGHAGESIAPGHMLAQITSISEIAAFGVLLLGLVLAVTVFVALRLYRASWTHDEQTPTPDASARERRLAMLRTGMLPPLLIACFLVIMFAQTLGVVSSATLLGLETEQPALRDQALVSLGAYVGAAMGIVFAGVVAPGVGPLLINGFAPRRWPRDALLGGGWFLVVLPMVLVTAFVSTQVAILLTGQTPEVIGHSTLRALEQDEGRGWAWALMVANVVIGAPIVEEVLYRGCVQSAVRRFLPAWGAIVSASVIFALIHIGSADARTLPGLFVLSLGMGLVYERTGRLLPGIVVHALFNALNIAVVALI
ncbi:MAG: hypothetical protein Tsb0013_08030 [Phycisphaerales bacterium]